MQKTRLHSSFKDSYNINKSSVIKVKFTIFFLYASTALWTLAAFQFLNLKHSRYDSLDGGSPRLKAATYIQDNTDTE
jgi:hypothetical protein